MTHTELICGSMGAKAPNMDHETGIHFGVIPMNHLNQDAADDIYSNGTDLGYQSAVAEFKDKCGDAAKSVIENELTDTADLMHAWIGDSIRFKDLEWMAVEIEDVFSELIPDKLDQSELTRFIFDGLEDQFNDSVCSGESGPYEYSDDDCTVLTSSDGDLWITKSKFWTYCGECSPCAPNAGYLTDRRDSLKAYCLGHDWFDNGKAPYPVYSVDTDEEVTE